MTITIDTITESDPDSAGPAPAMRASETPPEPDTSSKDAQTARVNEQCWLVDNYAKFVFTNQEYKDLTCMMGNPVDVMQKLSAKPGQESFLDMTPAKYALLVPLCRIFKYKVDPLSKDKTPKPVPGDPGKEIKFKTVFNEYSVAQDLGAQIADTMLGNDVSGKRGDQVGLKEMSYELAPGGAGNTKGAAQIVTIKFVGDSMSALHRQGVLDLVLKSNKYIYPAGGASKDGSNKIPNPDWFMIKLVYGWQMPAGHTLANGLTPSERQAIERAKTTLQLFMTEHELNFNKDGSVEVTAKFNGTADFTASQPSANILAAGAAEAKIKAEHSIAKAKLMAAEENQKGETEKAKTLLHAAQDTEADLVDKRLAGDKTQVTKAKIIKARAELEMRKHRFEGQTKVEGNIELHIKDKDTELEANLLEDRQARYAAVMTDLIAKDKLWFAEVPVEELDMSVYAKITAGPTKAPIIIGKDERSKETAQKGVGAIKEHLQKKVADKLAEKGTRHQQSRDTSRMNSSTRSLDDFNRSNFSTATTFEDGTKYRINFVYWGDVLSSVLHIAYKGAPPPRYLVGNFTFKDPMLGNLRSVNLADIPISLELFTTWWLERVIAPQKAFYTVREFIEDSVAQLIVAALGPDCNAYGHNFGQVGRKSVAPDSMKISYITFSAALGQGQKDRIANKPRVYLNGDDIKAYTASNQVQPTNYLKPEDQVEYTYIYCDAWGTNNKRGNRREDHREGIYHINIGNDTGPVTSVNFKRDDKFAEAKASQNANKQGAAQLGSYYHAEVDMLGSTLFMPGSQVYITPSALGMSAQLASQLGLGGYYGIQKLSGKIGSSGWRSTIDCRMQSQTNAEKAGSHDPAESAYNDAMNAGTWGDDPSTKK